MDTGTLSINSSVCPRGWHSVQKQTHEIAQITFDDVLEVMNPLNHIPLVSDLQDNPVSPVVRMVGSALLGGPVGFALSAIDTVFEEATGKSVIGNVFDAAFSSETETLEAQEIVAKRYRSIADAHKRHIHTWNA